MMHGDTLTTMRTTITIDDEVLARAKDRAAERRQTLGEFVQDAVALKLATLDTAPRPRVDPPVFTRGRFRAGIDVTTNRGLFDALDGHGATSFRMPTSLPSPGPGGQAC